MGDIPNSHKISGPDLVNALLKTANGGEKEGPVARYLREKKVRKAVHRLMRSPK